MSAKCIVACCLVVAAWTGAAPAQKDRNEPAVSLNPLSAEQLTVYRAVLARTADSDMPQVNLASKTVPLDASGPSKTEDCGKDLDLEPSSTLIHQFRAADLAQLGTVKIILVDPERGRQDVEENDPGRAIGKGASVDDAVRNGFAHGLFTLSEIRFDKKHEHAIVSYSFWCGGLCGHGETMILEKAELGWRKSGQCSDWIS